jgi:hypothetical protein
MPTYRFAVPPRRYLVPKAPGRVPVPVAVAITIDRWPQVLKACWVALALASVLFVASGGGPTAVGGSFGSRTWRQCRPRAGNSRN